MAGWRCESRRPASQGSSLGPLFRQRRDLATVVLVSLVGLVLLSSVFILWWGGESAPARLIFPAVPLLGIPLAAALSRWRHLAFRLPFLGLALFSLLLAALFLWHSDWLRFQDTDRIARPLKEWGLEHWAPAFPFAPARPATDSGERRFTSYDLRRVLASR